MATHTRRRPSWQVGAAVLATGAVLTGGCSVLFHSDASQCSKPEDCTARGTAFDMYTLCIQGTCVRPDASTMCMTNSECSGGLTCSPQHMCVAPVEAGADVIVEAGREAEAAVDAAREASTDAAVEAGAGEAGSVCRTTMDCIPADPTHPEVACDVGTNTCLQLTSDECPYLIPADYQSSMAGVAPPPPIFIGAFAKFPPGAQPFIHPSYLNYELALEEFRKSGPAIPAGPNTSSVGVALGRRTIVAVGCDVEGNIDNAMTHLINDVHVTSIVSNLPSASLNTVFNKYNVPPNNLFFINVFGFDSTFVGLNNNNRLWHMLGQPGDNAAAYAAFLPLVERYVRTTAPWSLGATAPLKVATVTANATVLNDLAMAVKPVLSWNAGLDGGTGNVASATNYLGVNISDSTINGTPLTDMNLLTSINNAVNALTIFRPQVIVSFASAEFVTLMENLEISWNAAYPLPFYVLSPYNEGDLTLQGDVPNLPYTVKRFAGIGVASTTDQQVLTDYETRFLTAYPMRSDALGAENYYDAMYFAVYSLVAAGRQTVTGTDLGTGMKLLLGPPPPAYTVGPTDMPNIFTVLGLQNNSPLELIGALGPPNFNTATGARVGQGDVYCIGSNTPTDGGRTQYPYDYDVLRLSNPDGGATPDGGSAFQGTFPCYPGIQ